MRQRARGKNTMTDHGIYSRVLEGRKGMRRVRDSEHMVVDGLLFLRG